MYRPVLVTPPATYPVTRDEAKQHLRIDHDDDNAKVETLIKAATSHLDGWTGILGRCLEPQTWRQEFSSFDRMLRAPLAPIISITHVKYFDTEAVEQTVAAPNYELLDDARGPYIRLLDTYSFPSLSRNYKYPLRLTYQAGYARTGDASGVPEDLRHAVLLLVGHWYEHREAAVMTQTVAPLPMAVDALIAPYRRNLL